MSTQTQHARTTTRKPADEAEATTPEDQRNEELADSTEATVGDIDAAIAQNDAENANAEKRQAIDEYDALMVRYDRGEVGHDAFVTWATKWQHTGVAGDPNGCGIYVHRIA